jgi:hypothetical protein
MYTVDQGINKSSDDIVIFGSAAAGSALIILKFEIYFEIILKFRKI